MPRVIKVIENIELIGKGTSDSPLRQIKRYYTLDGKFLGQSYDPIEDEVQEVEE